MSCAEKRGRDLSHTIFNFFFFNCTFFKGSKMVGSKFGLNVNHSLEKIAREGQKLIHCKPLVILYIPLSTSSIFQMSKKKNYKIKENQNR